MQLTTASMSAEPTVPEINHQEADDDEESNSKEQPEETDNNRRLLTASSSKNTKLSSRSPSPSPRPAATGPPDRALNQKFHVAALTGNLTVLQELVTKAHLPIDCRDKENSTALLLTCARGHYSCAEYLLANGADPNARRITGASPLYFAVSYHHTRIVELLLNKYKAIVDLSTFDGSTPLHVACEHGFADIVQLLIASQANINAKMNDGTTAIMLACQNGHLPIVQMLVSTGQCNLNIQRLDGVTALFLVVQNGHEATFDYLVANVDNIKETIDLPREDGASPIFKACQKGYESLVNKLLKYKPNLDLLKNGESVSRILSLFAVRLAERIKDIGSAVKTVEIIDEEW
jgi:ankyrin repeat protein